MPTAAQYASDAWEFVRTVKSETWSAWAAWFQAIGSVGAIIAAVAVAKHQSRVTRSIANEELTRHSEAVAALATVHAVSIRDEMRRIRKVITDNEANLGVLQKSGAEAALVDLLFTSAGIDAYLLSNASSLPREARMSFPQLIALKEMYNARMRELYKGMESSKELNLAAVNNTTTPLLGAIAKLLEETRKAAGATNDGAVLEIRSERQQ